MLSLEELRGKDESFYAFLAAFTAGSLEMALGQHDQARVRLDEALELGLAARSTPFVTLCLAAYAWLVFAEGDPERAARLEGAADGLRHRVGLPAWPHLRQVAATARPERPCRA